MALSSDSGLRAVPKDVPAMGICAEREVMVRVVSGVRFRVTIDSRRSVMEKIVRSAREKFAIDGNCDGEWLMV